MEGEALRLDGNAIAGTLSEVFVHEMTAARIACKGCGNVGPVGAEHAYVQAPGIVLQLVGDLLRLRLVHRLDHHSAREYPVAGRYFFRYRESAEDWLVAARQDQSF